MNVKLGRCKDTYGSLFGTIVIVDYVEKGERVSYTISIFVLGVEKITDKID